MVMGRLVTRLYQCRVCGSVIATSEGVERHGESCRLEGNKPNPNSMKQMAIVEFPCPIVLLDKISAPLPLENEDVASNQPVVNHGKSLRPRPRYNKYLKSDDEDDNTSDESEIENSSSDSDSDINTGPGVAPKKTRAICNNPDNPFACPMKGCNSRLKDKAQLKQHFIMHLENNPYACPIPGCDQKLAAYWYFKRHLDWHMNKNLLSCQKCGRVLSRTDHLRKHKCPSRKNWKKGPAAAVREKIATSEEDVVRFLKSRFANLKEKGFLLGDPDEKEIDLDSNPRIDMNLIIRTDPVFIEVCKETPGFEDLIIWPECRQQQYRLAPPQYKCNNCSFASRTSRTLRDHYSMMHSHRPWRCLKCGRTFKKEIYLEDHMKFHESTKNTIYVRQLENLKYECTKCGFRSKFEVSVRRHWYLMHNVTVPKQMNVVPKEEKKKRVRRKKRPAPSAEIHPEIANEEAESDRKEDVMTAKRECEIQEAFKVCKNKVICVCDPTDVKAIVKVEPEVDVETGSEMIVPFHNSNSDDCGGGDMQIKTENPVSDSFGEGDIDFCNSLVSSSGLKSESII